MQLTVAINRYDRHVPFFNGTVRTPKGLTIQPLEVGESAVYRDGTNRHERMLTQLAFDVAEVSLSSFIIAVARQPLLPLVGIPVFPRRFFSCGQIYVNAAAGIGSPKDLIGRKVGLHSFQTTLSVLGKGDLKLEFGVAWERIHWVCMLPEVVPVDLGRDAKVELMPEGKDMGTMLCEGEIDALISPHPRPSMLARPGNYRRLFPDVHAEEVRYFNKYGFYPIMHLVVLKRELADRYPDLPRELQRMFEDAKKPAFGYYADSNYSLLIDGRSLYEQQQKDFGADPWPNGFRRNRKNLDHFIGYSHDQRLIASPIPAAQLFHASTHDS